MPDPTLAARSDVAHSRRAPVPGDEVVVAGVVVAGVVVLGAVARGVVAAAVVVAAPTDDLVDEPHPAKPADNTATGIPHCPGRNVAPVPLR